MSVMGGLDLATVQQQESERLLQTYERYPILLTHGRGCYVYDAAGKEYLDLLSGIGVTALGHAHPAITEAIAQQAGRLVHTSNLFYHEFQAELGQKLTKLSGLSRAFFCNSGTEAVEGALKLARAFARAQQPESKRPKWRILAFENSFHGRTYGSVSITATKKYRAPFAPLVPGVGFVKANNGADFDKKFDDSVCAVVVEAIQGEGGIRPVNPEFLRHVREVTRNRGAVLIADEIQSGLGRTGHWFAYQMYDVLPDVVTVAKPLANGLPLGAILVSEPVAAAIHPGMHGTTFGGGPLACAVALKVLETIERQNLPAHNAEVGGYFRSRLEGLKAQHKFVREVRGAGLMLGAQVDTAGRAKAIVKEAMARGVILNRTNDKVLRFLPPFIISQQEIDRAIEVLEGVFGQVEKDHVK
ncbi:MAG TPA: aspartate aminotransferase family protein [Terriglobales bacterium]|nr:aspartate aminotransferase family protein [Terriglobales bacterium]